MLALLAVCLVAFLVNRNSLLVFAALACLVALIGLDRQLLGWYLRKRGLNFAAGAFVMQLVHRATNVASALYGAATHMLGRSTTSARMQTK